MTRTIRLSDFDTVVFFTGAGMSAESGVPTYRGKGGIWKDYDYENCACQAAFERDPRAVWEFHNYRRKLVQACTPNDGHRRIAVLAQQAPRVTVVTQNIDGLHQRAGSRNVLELHGSLWETRCDRCGARHERVEEPLAELVCACGGFKRPNIVWFGDVLFEDVVNAAVAAITNADVLVSIGTSAQVFPAAQLPLLARKNGAYLIEVNPEETPLSELYDLKLRASASQALRELW